MNNYKSFVFNKDVLQTISSQGANIRPYTSLLEQLLHSPAIKSAYDSLSENKNINSDQFKSLVQLVHQVPHDIEGNNAINIDKKIIDQSFEIDDSMLTMVEKVASISDEQFEIGKVAALLIKDILENKPGKDAKVNIERNLENIRKALNNQIARDIPREQLIIRKDKEIYTLDDILPNLENSSSNITYEACFDKLKQLSDANALNLNDTGIDFILCSMMQSIGPDLWIQGIAALPDPPILLQGQHNGCSARSREILIEEGNPHSKVTSKYYNLYSCINDTGIVTDDYFLIESSHTISDPKNDLESVSGAQSENQNTQISKLGLRELEQNTVFKIHTNCEPVAKIFESVGVSSPPQNSRDLALQSMGVNLTLLLKKQRPGDVDNFIASYFEHMHIERNRTILRTIINEISVNNKSADSPIIKAIIHQIAATSLKDTKEKRKSNGVVLNEDAVKNFKEILGIYSPNIHVDTMQAKRYLYKIDSSEKGILQVTLWDKIMFFIDNIIDYFVRKPVLEESFMHNNVKARKIDRNTSKWGDLAHEAGDRNMKNRVSARQNQEVSARAQDNNAKSGVSG